MLFVLMTTQSLIPLYNVGRNTQTLLKTGGLNLSSAAVKKNLKDRVVELVAFALMPNHFHFIVKELEEGGTSSYLQRIEIAYTKYFNAKYRRSGYLFQGPFQSVHVSSNEQLLHLSAYIHKNPAELSRWKHKEDLYPWSSYQDFVGENRWGKLLIPEIVRNQFDNPGDYLNFVKISGAKERLDQEISIDSSDQT